jgi:hypothetical protein
LLRGALASAFHLHLTPTEPGMLELALRLPVMSSARAREVLGWAPARDAGQAIAAFLAGLDGQGGPTPPLARATGGPFRLRELATGVGERP